MNAGQFPNACVLLVDDDKSVRRIAAHSLRRLGHHVIEADDGYQALAILESSQHPIKLVFSDVRMPGLSGDELARIVLQRWPGIPVLLTSGHARSGDFPDTDVQVLPKPYSRAELDSALRNTLRARMPDHQPVSAAASPPRP